ncbi:hypothetical protein [Methylobacterium sp. NEAU K]|uniref:hypothetical protein n=1 Tax=Methylobacterium sp. NEAU K TaxID=3064946 RepID=UPI0027368A72|nr:hypothetical protein [Methylobacterium sp. NEAU K]MDP4006392.1 hypothetical protein [Methylobacterium sp. NEAU K]
MSAMLRLAHLVEREAPRAADFAALTEVCEGAWPGDVRRLLAESPSAEARRLLASIKWPSARISSDRRLPLAHPLDADWRFTRECAERVLDAILSAASHAGDILLIAMPSVALAAYDRGLAHRVVIASRDGDPIDAALRAAMTGCRFVDLPDIPASTFQTVALDPPWYDDVALPLIETGLHAAVADGRVLICAPDHLTSPSSAQRLSALATTPSVLGFSAAEFVERVRYATPFFELRCLEAVGITGISPRWRTGLLYTCTPSPSASRGRYVTRAVGDGWREMRLGATRIWIRRLASQENAPDVGVARSISRTDPAREIASVWTSGNTYATNVGDIGPEAIKRALEEPAPQPWQRQFRAAMLDEIAAMERTVDFT